MTNKVICTGYFHTHASCSVPWGKIDIFNPPFHRFNVGVNVCSIKPWFEFLANIANLPFLKIFSFKDANIEPGGRGKSVFLEVKSIISLETWDVYHLTYACNNILYTLDDFDDIFIIFYIEFISYLFYKSFLKFSFWIFHVFLRGATFCDIFMILLWFVHFPKICF